MNRAILLQTHLLNPAIEAQHARLEREAPGWKVFLALNCGAGPERVPAGTRLAASKLFLCSERSLRALPYPAKCGGEDWRIVPGNADLIALLFLALNPDCERVWTVEYDVHYEGRWGDLFEHFEASPADLLTTTIHAAPETPGKRLSPPLKAPDGAAWPEARHLRAFLPIARLTRRGFQAIDAAYRAGAGGHCELAWPTILAEAGLLLEDIGGSGPFVRPENRDRFYFNTKKSYSLRPGTFVFRPGFERIVPRPNTLWHPVKPEGARPWDKASRERPRGLAGIGARLKPAVNHLLVRRWLATRWNPLA